MEQYFKCDPIRLCEKAACCRSKETKPVLGIGDYLRLSKLTNEPIEQIWRTKGDIALSGFDDMEKNVFLISLSLFHEPCPYLNKDYQCQVHNLKPLACAGFPILLYMFKPDAIKSRFKNYQCIACARPSPEQIKFGKALDEIIKEEAEGDYKFLWNNNPLYISVPTFGDYFTLAKQALNIQRERDRMAQSSLSQRVIKAVNQMSSFVNSNKIKEGLDVIEYAESISPLVLTMLHDKIAYKLSSLSKEVLKYYESTTSKFERIVNQIS